MKRNNLAFLTLFLLVATLPACSKKSSSDSCSSEAALAVTTTPANNSTEAPAPGPDFPLTVTITSAIPSGGVTITVKARPEASTTAFFTANTSSSSSTNNFTITGTPANTSCIVEITVASKGCSTNKWSGSYRYSMK